jgi:cytochrome c oxidase subunit I+III
LLTLGALASATGCGAALAGPWTTEMDPTAHVYPAIVWVLVSWTVVHGAVGVLMQAYCLARSVAGRLTPRHDMELHNVALYWHFMLVTALVTFGVVGLFPKAL